MKLAPFFSYYGSKHRIAGRYPHPVTGHIVEPFAGSAAYACRYPHLKVTLCEANPKVAGVWDYLIRAPESEIRALPLIQPDTLIAELPLPQEARHLIAFWCNRGDSHPARRPSRWMTQYQDRMHQCQFWGEAARHRVARQQPYIRHWKLVCGDYRDLAHERADWFVDPPYDGPAGKHYRSRPLDYAVLGDWCRERVGQVIACENVGASWLPFVPFLTAQGTNGAKRSGTSREAIWHRSDEPPFQGDLLACALMQRPPEPQGRILRGDGQRDRLL